MAKAPRIDLSTLPKLAARELRLLWVNDWYEGPSEAVVEHEGAHCLMVLVDGGGAPKDGAFRWVVVRLTPEQYAEEEKWHALYSELVGEHWCFHGAATSHGSARAERDPARFEQAIRARSPLDLSANTAVGWLDEMPVG